MLTRPAVAANMPEATRGNRHPDGAPHASPFAMETDLRLLEQKLATLIEHTRALRAANESLRHDLAAAVARGRDVDARVAQAGARLDALLAQMGRE